MGNTYARIKPSVAEPDALRSREAHVRPVRIASRRLVHQNPRFSGMRNLMRGVPQVLMYSSRPKARTAHIAPARLAHQNPLFEGVRNLSAGLGGVAAVGGFDVDGEIELHHHVSALISKKRRLENGVAVLIANHPVPTFAGNGKELAKPVMLGMVAIG